MLFWLKGKSRFSRFPPKKFLTSTTEGSKNFRRQMFSFLPRQQVFEFWLCTVTYVLAISVTILGDLLHFGQTFKSLRQQLFSPNRQQCKTNLANLGQKYRFCSFFTISVTNCRSTYQLNKSNSLEWLQKLSGSVCAYHSADPGSNPKLIYGFSIYIWIAMWKGRKQTKRIVQYLIINLISKSIAGLLGIQTPGCRIQCTY